MATTINIPDATRVSPRPPRPSPHTTVTFELLIAAVGLGTTVLVGLDGSWLWCVVRILLVGVVISRAMAVVHRGSQRASAIVAVALGLLAAPAGGGVALPFLIATGVSLRAAAGALVAAAAVVLLVLGTVVLTRSIGGWKAVAGASSTRSNVLDEATVLAHHGYGVLLFDPRGMARSGGRAMNFGW